MITLYTWGTPNGRKVSIMLEECALTYRVAPVDITRGEQKQPDFLAISPNGRIPAIEDDDGPSADGPFRLFESGAILLYLAEKCRCLLPDAPAERHTAMAWLMWQMGGFGPMLGQAHHFLRFAPEPIPYAIKRYSEEAARLYGVLDRRLAEAPYLAGETYSVADIACFPWAARHEWQQIDLAAFPNVARWYAVLAERPAVQRGMAIPA